MNSKACDQGEPRTAAAQESAAEAYLAACDATRKAWHQSLMLHRVKLKQIDAARGVLMRRDAAAIAELLCEMSGPIHPGPNPGAAGTVSEGSWRAASTLLAKAALTAVLAKLLARGPGGRDGSIAAGPLCAETLKDWIVHWIRSGSLPCAGADGAADRAEAGRLVACEATMISDWLIEQARAHQMPGTPIRPDWQRLAVVAISAPAVEGLVVVARMDEGYLRTLRAREGEALDGRERKEGPGADPHLSAQADEFQAKSGPMKRSAEDDSAADDAFQALSGRARNAGPSASGPAAASATGR